MFGYRNMEVDAEQEKRFYKLLAQSKTLILGVDPGYDAYKIVINGEFSVTIGSLALHPGAASSMGLNLIDDATTSLMLEDEEGGRKRYVMGEIVQAILAEDGITEENQKIVEESKKTAERFGTEAFKASFIMAILTALSRYARTKNRVGFTENDVTLKNWNVYMNVALPNDYMKAAREKIEKVLSEPVNGSVTVGGYKYELKDFEYGKFRYIRYSSQVLDAYFSVLYTQHGSFKKKESLFELKDDLPVLICDFGRKTFAAAIINEKIQAAYGRIIEGEDPNQFAMLSYEERTAYLINRDYGDRLRNPLLAANVGMYCDGNKQLYANKESGRGTELVNVQLYRDQVIRESQSKMIEYIDKRFSMDSVRSIFVCGGTGQILTPYLQASYNRKDFPQIKYVEMIEGYVNNHSVGSVFAVACGAYEDMAYFVYNKLKE